MVVDHGSIGGLRVGGLGVIRGVGVVGFKDVEV